MKKATSPMVNLLALALVLLGAGQSVAETVATDTKALHKERSTYLKRIDCTIQDTFCGKPSILSPNVLVLGDSHAVDAFNTFYSAFPEVNIILSSAQQCVPFVEEGREDKCADINNERWEKINSLPKVAAVVVKIRIDGKRGTGLVEFVKELAEKYPKLIVFGAGPRYSRPLSEVYEKFGGEKLDEFREEEQYKLDEEIRTAVESVGGLFIDQREFFCPNGVCSDLTRDGTALVVVDNHHQTLRAAEELGKYIRAQMPTILEPK